MIIVVDLTPLSGAYERVDDSVSRTKYRLMYFEKILMPLSLFSFFKYPSTNFGSFYKYIKIKYCKI